MPGRRLTTEPPAFVDQPPAPPNHPHEGSFMVPPPETAAPYQETSRRLVADEGQTMTTLDDEERFEFSTLLQVGKGSDTLNVLGHTVVVENLNVDDDLRVGQFCKPYLNSDAYERAWQLATCAAGVRTIDGRPVYNSLEANPSAEEVFTEKAAKLARYTPVVITEIYRGILAIDVDFVNVAIKMGKLKG
jgi:hypothetical protein